ncbi:ABC transporter ATP-binding protein [Clostridium lundense]|uniref:ABC transporter ATP-binding protein n=1 Tax=Clostridium lundense TaxID=319475 RepID=UPI000480B8E2|nr:ABC transporter ATP-binding protein [Clostridium lundense]
MMLQLKNVCNGYKNEKVVKNINLTVKQGEAVCILGPNGVGKTTLFKTILGFIKPKSGEILLEGKNIFSMDRREIAKIIGYVPQGHIPPFPYRVKEVVIMGRCPYIGSFGSPSLEDENFVDNLLNKLKIYDLRDKYYTEISGGERQLVLIARALAQEPKLLIMDEPTSNLDFGNQIRVLEHIRNLVTYSNIGLVMTTHHPNHVFLCGTEVVLMKNGEVFKSGDPLKIMTKENLKEIYGVSTCFIDEENIKAFVPII